MTLLQKLDASPTAYQAVGLAAAQLEQAGFARLDEAGAWTLEPGKGYFVIRDGSALIAFFCPPKAEGGFLIAAAHTDSPALKLKYGRCGDKEALLLPVEAYGGGIFYSFLDRPLAIAGRLILEEGACLRSLPVVSRATVVIPSVAVHFNREVNKGLTLNPQTDLRPLCGLDPGFDVLAALAADAGAPGARVRDFDLFLVNRTPAFRFGFGEELICAPRIDNLTSCFAAVDALTAARPSRFAVVYLADHEEIGSRTPQGAASSFLRDTLRRAAQALGRDFDGMLAESFLLSADNAHARHPNHPELSDPDHPVLLNGGVVVKHHANRNYTTDALSSALIRKIFEGAGVRVQDFFMRSDLRCGGTLGALASTLLPVRSADIGLAQLAMHAAAETVGAADFEELVRGLTAFFQTPLTVRGEEVVLA